MIFVYNYGTPLTTAQATALNSFVALATTPAGNHLAKDSNGEFVNTPDTGGGGSGITTLNTLTATTQTFADVDDTNVTLAINSATSTHTFTLGWTGTLASSRLNANVVQAVSNDTNVTGSISTQTLTLGWTGTLAVSRGGLGTSLAALTTNNLAKYNGTNFVDSLLASTVSGARAIFAGTLGADRTYTLPNSTGTIALVTTTSDAITVGTIELGNASDTTISRAAAGDLAVEGVSVLTTSNTKTVTGKRIQPRTASSTTASTLTPDLSSANVYFRTTQTATLTIEAPTGTPVIGETIMIYVDSAAAQTLTINATYIPFGAAFPATTTAGKTFMMSAQYNGTNWKTLWANAV